MKLDTDTMNATERALTLIEHKEPDRVPTYVMGIPVYSKCYKEFWAKEDEVFDDLAEDDDNILLTPLGDFTMRYYFGSEVETTGFSISSPSFSNFMLDDQGKIIEDRNEPIYQNPPQEGRYVNHLGTIHGYKILPGGDRYDWYIDGYFSKKEDVLAWYDRWGWPGAGAASRNHVDNFITFQKQFGDRIFAIPQISGHQLYESTWVILGQARWAYWCRKDPDFIKRLIDDRKEAQLKMLDEISRTKPVIVFGGDDMGQKGRPMLSPEMYRKFFKEPYSEIFQKVHDMGAIIFNHSCGNIVELLPDMIEAGLDGWQSLEPASLIDHEFVKKKYGDKFLLVGGLDSREISFGTKDSIEKHVQTQIRKMAKGGGFIAGPTHDFLTETPLQNCLDMRDAIHKFGKYPIL